MTATEFHAAVRLGSVRTVPNVITAVRTIVAVAVGVAALQTGSMVLLLVAYGCYWLGDILDGWTARRLRQETRTGAVFDIVSDRACTAVLCLTLVTLIPDVALVAVVFLLSFMVLDTMLSLAFLCWPVVSPNYFHLVDRRIWQLNWSTPAKAANTAGVIAAVACGQFLLALGIALAVVAVKLWSAVAVVQLLNRQGRHELLP
jgi:CDP-diacylglycerol--glycerol-3-phosphate 3-phosphatidyltransferase